MEDFVNRGGGVDESEIKILGDFGIGGVDFLLKLIRLDFKSFFGLATTMLAFVADFIGDRKNKAVIWFEISVWQ